MRLNGKLSASILAATVAFATVGLAQQDGSSATKAGGMMKQMMAEHQNKSELMNKMMQSMKAIKEEKDPAKLRVLINEHSALMDQMHAKMLDEEKKMRECPMMVGEEGKAGEAHTH